MELFSGDRKRKGGQRAPREKKEREGRGSARPNGKKRTAAMITIIVVCVVVIACAAGVIAVNGVKTVYPNVTLDGMDIGGMTDLELSKLLFEKGYESQGEQPVTVMLPLDFSLEIKASEVCTDSNVADIVDNVMLSCRGGSNIKNAVTYIKCLTGGMELESGGARSVDEEAVRALVENKAKEVNLQLMSSDVEIGEESVTVIKGASSITLDTDEITKLVVNAFLTLDYAPIEYEGTVNSDEGLDVDKLYENVFREAENAQYDPETDSVTPEVCGMRFDTAEATRLWNAAKYGERVEIPLEITEPEISAEYLESVLFRDCFCKKATSLIGSSANRINNITKAAASIDGIIMMPGDEFSYNDALGERTAKNGYLTAGAYSGGQTVQEYGGGICQVSSTLYYCALYANLKITDRSCHMFPVAYLPAGLDATVSWGGPEFKFVNDRDFPVRIRAYVENNTVVVELWGTNVDGSYVEMTYATAVVYDSKYTDVAIGYKATTYRSVFDKNGNLINKTTEARSTYRYHDEDIKWPEESPEATETPEVTEEPAPSVEPTTEPTPTVPVEPTPTVEPTVPVEPETEPENTDGGYVIIH